MDSNFVENRPSLRSYTIKSLTGVGRTYRFKIRAFNNAGYTESAILSVILSSVPETPIIAPISDASVTNEYRIKVFFGPLPLSNNRGSEILTYEL